MAKKTDFKQRIEQNHSVIHDMLSGAHSFHRLNNLNWIRSQFKEETQILFQAPSWMSKSERNLYIDYTTIKNLGLAWDYILENRKTPIDTIQIRAIHSILTNDTNIAGGAYRTSDLYIERLQMHAPNYHKMLYKMDTIEYNIYNPEIPILTRAFNTHYDLIETQPFNDFNKRTARMVMNWILIQNDYEPILFNKRSDKTGYMSAIFARAQNDNKTYSHFMYNCMIRTQKEILKHLTNSKVF